MSKTHGWPDWMIEKVADALHRIPIEVQADALKECEAQCVTEEDKEIFAKAVRISMGEEEGGEA